MVEIIARYSKITALYERLSRDDDLSGESKSIGEVVINTPLPAVADAIYHATHKRFYELPITREQIALAGQ